VSDVLSVRERRRGACGEVNATAAFPNRKEISMRTGFPHERLDAYRVAQEALDAATVLAGCVPRGHRGDADQLVRAASSAVRNIAEGANRWGAGEKRSRFSIARGEAGEAAAVAEYLARRGVVAWTEALTVIHLEDRVGAMLTGLIKRHT
jgi:four helix bundle protein